MVMTNPYHTESSTAYPELDEIRSALIIPAEVTNVQVQEERFTATEDPAEVWVPRREEGLLARITRVFLASYDWLVGPGTTDRDRMYRDIAEARSEWNGLL